MRFPQLGSGQTGTIERNRRSDCACDGAYEVCGRFRHNNATVIRFTPQPEGQPSRLFHAEDLPMCDYSLHFVASRPAKVGDKLVTTKFGNSITGGFAAVGEPNVAVCLMPGTEVAFENEVRIDHVLGRLLPRSRFGRIEARVARFRQINMDQPHTHHDALEFPNGQIVSLTRLREGQFATVLQLPAAPREVPSQAKAKRAAEFID
jgi:hypothetical protein